MSRIITLALALCLAAGFTQSVQAKSSLTVVNGWNQDVDVGVFDATERACQKRDASDKGSVKAGEAKEFSCKGEGKDRCRVTIWQTDTRNRYCSDIYHNCSGKGRDVEDGGAITLSGTGETPDCAVFGKDGALETETGAQ